jgi:hypothetical protein
VYPPAVAVAVTVTVAPSDKAGLNDPDVAPLKSPLVPPVRRVRGIVPVMVVDGPLVFVMTMV